MIHWYCDLALFIAENDFVNEKGFKLTTHTYALYAVGAPKSKWISKKAQEAFCHRNDFHFSKDYWIYENWITKNQINIHAIFGHLQGLYKKCQ